MGWDCCYDCWTRTDLVVMDSPDGRTYYLCKSCKTKEDERKGKTPREGLE